MRIDNASSMNLLDSGQSGSDLNNQLPTGTWRGDTVQVTSQGCDILTDAAEEITMAHSEHVEERKLEEREIETRPEFEVPGLEEIQVYLETSGQDDAAQKLKDFVDALVRNQGRGEHGKGGAREEAKRHFGNPTDQFMALSFAAQELDKQGGHDALLSDVRGALEDLYDDYSGHIRADLNTIGIAAEFGHGNREEIANFQAGYRDAVLGGDNLSGMLKGALERFGEKDYGRAVSSLIAALGADLSSIQGASSAPARLNAVVQELYMMEVLSTVLEGCQGLAQRMGTEHGVKMQAGDVMQDLVAASAERWTTGSRFSSIAEKHGAGEVAPKIAFLNTAKALVRNMPPKVFTDADARINTVTAVQEALDEAIAREDQ